MSKESFPPMRDFADGQSSHDYRPIPNQGERELLKRRAFTPTNNENFSQAGRPEMIHPASDCFVRNCNSALREQIFDVTKAEREPEIKPDRLVNDLRREPISGIADFRHALRLRRIQSASKMPTS